MPDLTFQTVSASQVPDLLNISPWGTRLTLHHQFARRVHEDREQTIRMKIGKLFEALILELTAAELTLEVRPNPEAVYVRHPTLPLGCTVDAEVLCPTRGRGTIEAKAIDEYEWKRSWTETSAPKYYEAQLQAQMLAKGDDWGLIACFIYTEEKLILYERRPNIAAQARISKEATAFMADVAAGTAPPAFGLPVELELMTELYPEADPAKVIEATDNYDMAELARLYAWSTAQRSSFEKAEKEMKPRLLDFLKDAGAAHLAGGVKLRVNKPVVAGKVIMLPADLRKRLRDCSMLLKDNGQVNFAEMLMEAVEWCHIQKQPSIQSRLSVFEDEATAAPEGEFKTKMDAG